MQSGTKYWLFTVIKPFILTLIALSLFIFSYFPDAVEMWYSTALYPAIGNTLRTLTRWLPFSLGDILYGIFVIWLIVKLLKGFQAIRNKTVTKKSLLLGGIRCWNRVVTVYIVFKLLWGLNYHRLGIASQLGIQRIGYHPQELVEFTNRIIDSLNVCRRQIPDSLLPDRDFDTIYRLAYRGYEKIAYRHSFLSYTNRSVKPSCYTFLADYFGFTGYYNPFTGEAQLRTDVPRILVSFVASHEMAHQLGYASESEANFVGYLAAISTNDVYAKYATYLEIFSYAQREEMFVFAAAKDSVGFHQTLRSNRSRLDTLVKKDRKHIRDFFLHRRNNIAPAINGLYDQYLKMNQQSSGVNSYDEVIGWIIAYDKRYEKK